MRVWGNPLHEVSVCVSGGILYISISMRVWGNPLHEVSVCVSGGILYMKYQYACLGEIRLLTWTAISRIKMVIYMI